MARTEGTETRRHGSWGKYHTEAQRGSLSRAGIFLWMVTHAEAQRGFLKLAAWYIMERLRGRGYGWRGRVRV